VSGEAIVITAPAAALAVAGPIALAAAALAGTAAVGTLAARGIATSVAAIIDAQVEAARQRAAAERERMAAQEAFEGRQKQAMDEAKQRHDAVARMQESLARVRLPETLPEARRQPAENLTGRTESKTEPRLPAVPNHAVLTKTLDDLSTLIDGLPENLRNHPHSPTATLQQQVKSYRDRLHGNRPPSAAQVEEVMATARRSITDFRDRLQQESVERDKRLARTDAALNLVLVLEQLPMPRGSEVGAIRSELVAALGRGEIPVARLADLENRLKTLAGATAAQIASGALRPALADALLRHLRALGYDVLAPFSAPSDGAAASASVRVPDGGQVAIHMDTDGRLKFTFAHERQTDEAGPLSEAEQTFARQQEARWCKDLKAAVSGLVAEGFESRVTFDRRSPDIPVVVHVPVASESAAETGSATPEAVELAEAAEEERRRRRIQTEQQR